MQAGKLRHRIIIQDKGTPTRDTFGQEVISWETHATLWAQVSPITGRETVEGSAQLADITHQIRIRSFAGVAPSMRVLWGSRIFDIQQVRDLDERGVESVLLAQEIVTD